MSGQKGGEADYLSVWWAKLRKETLITLCRNTLLCPPLDMPCSCMIRLFLEEKDFEFNRDAIWTEINAWDAAAEETSAASLNLQKVPNALKLFIHLRVLSKCNPNCFRLAEAGYFSSFPVSLKKNCFLTYQVYLLQPVALLCQWEILKLILLVDDISVLRTACFGKWQPEFLWCKEKLISPERAQSCWVLPGKGSAKLPELTPGFGKLVSWSDWTLSPTLQQLCLALVPVSYFCTL